MTHCAQVMAFLGSIRQDYAEGFGLDYLNSALTTLSEVSLPLTSAQFELLAEIGSMRTIATESRVLALHGGLLLHLAHKFSILENQKLNARSSD